MKLRVTFWLAALVFFLASLALLGPLLPERVATHFGASGAANGWMPRSSHLLGFGFFGVGLSSFVVGLLYAVRWMPPKMLNVPHPEYWRSPEHYREACDYLFQGSLWFGTLMALWAAALHALIFQANRQVPAHLDGTGMAVLTALLLAGSAVWMLRIFRFFNRSGRNG